MQIYGLLGCRALTKPVSCQSVHLSKGSAGKAKPGSHTTTTTTSISKNKYHSNLCFKTNMNPLSCLTL